MTPEHCHTEVFFEPASFDEVIRNLDISNLKIIVNSRLKRSWHVKINTISDFRTLTIPSYLQNAPFEVKKALVEWATLPQKVPPSRKEHLVSMKRSLEASVQNYISKNHATQSGHRLNISTDPMFHKGVKYDLLDIFDTVNREYFNSELKALLRWGNRTSGTSYQMTRRLSSSDHVNVITIAGCYNHPDIPRFAIEAVMYHEMLHIKIPPYKKNGRNIIHGQEFRLEERKFRYFKEWRSWEKEHLRLIVRNLRRKK